MHFIIESFYHLRYRHRLLIRFAALINSQMFFQCPAGSRSLHTVCDTHYSLTQTNKQKPPSVSLRWFLYIK